MTTLSPTDLDQLETALTQDCGPFPWQHTEKAGEIADAEGYPIGKFWGGPCEWVDRGELVVLLANNASALISAARRVEEVERRHAETEKDACGWASRAEVLQVNNDICTSALRDAKAQISEAQSAREDLQRQVDCMRGAAEDVLSASASLVVKAVRAPKDAEGLEGWTAAVTRLRVALSTTQAKGSEG